MMAEDPSKLTEAIERTTASTRRPDGREQHVLTVRDVDRLADQFNMAGCLIEIEALRLGITPLRYQRNFTTLTVNDQIRLLQSRAVIVGLGGLGGTVTEILARLGVGHLVLVDADVFEEHNLNRQLFCSHAELGQSKAAVAARHVRSINASLHVDAWQVDCDDTNRNDLFRHGDIVVDCLDNIPSRFVLQDGARQAGIPLISAAVAGLSGHVTVIFPEDQGLELIFGPRSSAHQGPKGIETVLGCLPQSVYAIASMESAEAVKVLLGVTDHLLRNKLLVIDLEHNTFETLRLV
jgi:molybdopterin/thiamine biosynthesis adenylyltransferase